MLIAISTWRALFTAGYPRVDTNVRNIYKRVNCMIEDLLETQRAAAMWIKREIWKEDARYV